MFIPEIKCSLTVSNRFYKPRVLPDLKKTSDRLELSISVYHGCERHKEMSIPRITVWYHHGNQVNTITSVIVAKQTVINEVYVYFLFCFFNKISLKYINFIYSAD